MPSSKEIDIEDFRALEQYLRERRYIGQGEPMKCEKLTGGVSNKAVRVVLPGATAWVLKQALPKLRVSSDWFSDPQRVHVEANGLRWLNRLAPRGSTPALLWEDRENHLLAMESVPSGHENWKSALLAEKIRAEYFEQFGALLGTIHRCSSEAETEVRSVFESTVHFESLRLNPYYVSTAENIPQSAKFFRELIDEIRAQRVALVHGDFSPKNTLIHRGQLVILDYEVIHFGDPAFDAGFALTHFLSKAHHLPQCRIALANGAKIFWRAYFSEISRTTWARAVEARAVRNALGCLLARVAGKSPLEYLNREERSRQADVVLSMIYSPPQFVPNLVDEFVEKISHR
jgi:aminoglycoside phosphotransferase (APT) family kinase protein